MSYSDAAPLFRRIAAVSVALVGGMLLFIFILVFALAPDPPPVLPRSLKVHVTDEWLRPLEGVYVCLRPNGPYAERAKNHNDDSVCNADITNPEGVAVMFDIQQETVTVDAILLPHYVPGRRTLDLPITEASGPNMCYIKLYKPMGAEGPVR